MRFRFPFLLILLFLSAPSFAESMNNLVWRDGTYYKKFTDVPFTGEINEGWHRGSLKDGLQEGFWESDHVSGGLASKIEYKNGRQEGVKILYFPNGQLWMKGIWKGGKKEGFWEGYTPDGAMVEGFTGTYKNDVRVSN